MCGFRAWESANRVLKIGAMSSEWLLGEPPGIPICERVVSSLYKIAKKASLPRQESCYFILEKTRGEGLVLLHLSGAGE